MNVTIKATYENGVLKPKELLALIEGSEVELMMIPRPDEEDPLAQVIGIADSGRKDGADEHDHYIYGTPRR